MERKEVAIFDLRGEDCAHTADTVSRYFGGAAEIVTYTEMQAFVFAFRDRLAADRLYDMMFIGVDNFTGLEAARNIREQDRACLCPMFLVSEVEDYGLEGFRLHALDYITKPVSLDRVQRAIERIGNGSKPIKRPHREKRISILTEGRYEER